MSEQKYEDLDALIPRPEINSKRHMIACDPEAYEYISELAEKLDTSRNRIVAALVEFYRKQH